MERIHGDIVKDSETLGWCFVDWNLNLNKQASAQGIYLCALKAGIRIAKILQEETTAEILRKRYEQRRKTALDYFYDPAVKMFTSGSEKQLSAASQIWMIHGGVLAGREASELLDRIQQPDVIQPITPYLMHYLVGAYIKCGEQSKALQLIKDYWGGMVKESADTFWELYDPADPSASPYGGTIVNSFCHAWSCAPVYFLRTYFQENV